METATRIRLLEIEIAKAVDDLRDTRDKLAATQDYEAQMKLYKEESEQEEFIQALWIDHDRLAT